MPVNEYNSLFMRYNTNGYSNIYRYNMLLKFPLSVGKSKLEIEGRIVYESEIGLRITE